MRGVTCMQKGTDVETESERAGSPLTFAAAELARSRRARGLRLTVPEATALIADTVAEVAKDGGRLDDAITAGRQLLTPADVLDGVTSVVTEVQVEATFDDGTRLAVVTRPFGAVPERATGPWVWLFWSDTRECVLTRAVSLSGRTVWRACGVHTKQTRALGDVPCRRARAHFRQCERSKAAASRGATGASSDRL